MNNKYVCEKAAAELSRLKELCFWYTKNTFSGKPLPEHHPQMEKRGKAATVEASALTGHSTDTPI